MSGEHNPVSYKENISLRVAGNQMQKSEGYNLEYVLTSLNLTESMIKKTYLHIKGGERYTKEDRKLLEMKLMNVEDGSLIAGLKIAYSDIIVPAIPLIIENKEIIWNSIKSSYEFLKAKITAAKEGKELTITQTTDTGGNNFLVKDVSDSTVNIYVYPGVDRLADELAPEFASMAKIVDGDQISSVEFTNSDTHDDFTFTPEDKELFSRQTYTEDSVITITGKIYGGDFKSQSGKIDVISSSDSNVVSGDMYPFKINGNLDTEETWKEMFLEEKTYFCKKRIEINTTKNPIISVLELIIIDFGMKQEVYEAVYLDLDN